MSFTSFTFTTVASDVVLGRGPWLSKDYTIKTKARTQGQGQDQGLKFCP